MPSRFVLVAIRWMSPVVMEAGLIVLFLPVESVLPEAVVEAIVEVDPVFAVGEVVERLRHLACIVGEVGGTAEMVGVVVEVGVASSMCIFGCHVLKYHELRTIFIITVSN